MNVGIKQLAEQYRRRDFWIHSFHKTTNQHRADFCQQRITQVEETIAKLEKQVIGMGQFLVNEKTVQNLYNAWTKRLQKAQQTDETALISTCQDAIGLIESTAKARGWTITKGEDNHE